MEIKLVQAMDAASRLHEGQRYGEFPYVRHLAHVAIVLTQFGFVDADLLAAAWLHDAIEDTDVSDDELTASFGAYVADLVTAVTDGKGKNRAERHAASFRRMVKFPESIIIKLADRIANVESSVVSGGRLLGMYAKEYPEFRAKLYAASLSVDGSRTRVAAMWSHLHALLEANEK